MFGPKVKIVLDFNNETFLYEVYSIKLDQPDCGFDSQEM